MDEAGYTDRIRKKLPGTVYALKLCLPYTGGVPDAWYSGPAGDLWVEYKYYSKLPPVIDLLRETEKTPPKLSRLQQAWLESRHEEGRQVAVIIGSPQGGIVLPELTWRDSVARGDFLSGALDYAGVADWIVRRVA